MVNVDILCKTLFNTPCKSTVKICAKKIKKLFNVQNLTYSHTFPFLSTTFNTAFPYLLLTNLFHYSTYPTITTTKYLYIEN